VRIEASNREAWAASIHLPVMPSIRIFIFMRFRYDIKPAISPTNLYPVEIILDCDISFISQL